VAELFGGDIAEGDDEDEEEGGAAEEGARVGMKDEEEDDDDEDVVPAWVDEDDAGLELSLQPRKLRKLRTAEEASAGEALVSGEEYQRRLRTQLKKVKQRARGLAGARWASLRRAEAAASASRSPSSSSSSSTAAAEAVLLRSTSTKLALGARKDAALRPAHIVVSRVPDANTQSPARSGTVSSVAWNPRHNSLLAVASLEGRCVSLFAIDGKLNAHVATADTPDLPVCETAWTVDGAEAIVVGARPHFYVVDAHTGRVTRVDRIVGRDERAYPHVAVSPDGKLLALYGDANGARGHEALLLNAATKQLVATVRNPGRIRAATFTHDGARLLATGTGGEVLDWDMRTMRCLRRWADEGAVNCTAIAASPGGSFFAVGSDTGVVNIYTGESVKAAAPTAPKPLKAIMNITIPVDHAVFNHDGQLLAISAHEKKDVLKLVHLPSCTVYANWPLPTTPLHHVESVAFSPNSGMLAIGNKRGKALLYRLCHWHTI